MLRAESHLFGTIRRSLRERLGVLVVRSSLVTAYAAALGTTVWATLLELDRLPRSDLPLAREPPPEAQPVVPADE
jgi:hypothetical protein